jgi:LytS/YehU family sensor histidine kinase
MSKLPVEISFPGVSPDVANELAESLAKDVRMEVRDEGRPIDTEIRRTDPTAMATRRRRVFSLFGLEKKPRVVRDRRVRRTSAGTPKLDRGV